MSTNVDGSNVAALLIALILLASIICGLIFVICTIVLCKFCYEKKKNEENREIRAETVRNRRGDSHEQKLCRKLLGQNELSKPSQKIILKALDSDLDSLSESYHSHLVNASVQTEESSFKVKGNIKTDDPRQSHLSSVVQSSKRQSSPNPNDFKPPIHSKSRVKVQIQNYITPIANSNNLQITQSVIRRYSDNSPYKDEEAMEAEAYSRGRSASQIPQSYRMSPTPSISVLPQPNEDANANYCLVTPATQRRGSHHLRPFDTHWGHNKLSHSMEVVSSKSSAQTEDRKVHSFDNAIARKRVSSAQSSLYHARSLTMSTSEDAATSSLEEANQQIFATVQIKQSKIHHKKKSPTKLKEIEFLPNEVRTYTFQNKIPGVINENLIQRSYQNIIESPSKDNYKARKSYVGEFNANQEHPQRRSPHHERRARKCESTSSSWNQSQISSKDSITINIIDSDSEKNNRNISLPSNHPKLSISSMIDPSLSPQTAEARRRQFSRERQSLIQASDINELHQKIDSSQNNWSCRQGVNRDYSIDERSSVLFNEFMREDPKLGKHAMEAQMLERIRIQRKGTTTPTKISERSRPRLENKKAASFATTEEIPNDTYAKDSFDGKTHLNYPQMTTLQQRRQSIGKMKVQSCDHRIQLPVIILPEDSP